MDGAPACPFVAFGDDRDGRSTSPDHRHRCFAESPPAPRALAHQEAYCLSSAFPVCPTFQDWARREAAHARGGGERAETAPTESRRRPPSPPPDMRRTTRIVRTTVRRPSQPTRPDRPDRGRRDPVVSRRSGGTRHATGPRRRPGRVVRERRRGRGPRAHRRTSPASSWRLAPSRARASPGAPPTGSRVARRQPRQDRPGPARVPER